MSAHRAPHTASPTWHRSRAAIGGAAMTTLFLTGGAGVACAGDGGHDEGSTGGNSLQVLSGNKVGNNNLNGNEVKAEVLGDLPDLDLPDIDLPDVDLGGDKTGGDKTGGDKTGSDNDVKGDHNNVGNVNSFNNTTNNHTHTHEGRDCGCPKDQEKHDDDCDAADSADADAATNGSKDEPDTDDVASEDTDDVASDSEDSDSDATIVPVGSADTGDGSVPGPLPAPAIAPVASSWSMADSMFTGGGIAAAALLASAGVSMARHRREGAHRA